MAHIVSMINWKGGVGKTTLAYHIGIGLWKFLSKRTLVIDLDPQANLSFLAVGGASNYAQRAYKSGKPSTLLDLYDRYFDGKPLDLKSLIHEKATIASEGRVWTGVDIVLSHQELILVDLKLARERRAAKDFREETKHEITKLSILAESISEIADNYDYILLDCPPNINLTTQNALFASTHFVIPAKADFLSTVGISLIKKKMKELSLDYDNMWKIADPTHQYKGAKPSGIIFNEIVERSGSPKKPQQDIIDAVRLQNPGDVFDSYLTEGGGITDASKENLPVYALHTANAQKQSAYLERIVNEFAAKII
ncbi:TPA: ParA family protein [Aeromonas salmonicida]|nr:ParA family protein [Aeromonas salmonicida]